MWEIGVIGGLSFVPMYLHHTAKESENQAYKAVIYIFNLALVGMVLLVAKQIAELNDAGIAVTVNYIYIAYTLAAVFLIFLFVITLIRQAVGKSKNG